MGQIIRAGSTGFIRHEDFLYPYPDINNEEAHLLVQSIQWDNYIDDESENDAYYPMESVMYNKCAWANEMDWENGENVEMECIYDDVLAMAKLYGDTEFSEYLSSHADKKDAIDWGELSEYFSNLTEDYERLGLGVPRKHFDVSRVSQPEQSQKQEQELPTLPPMEMPTHPSMA